MIIDLRRAIEDTIDIKVVDNQIVVFALGKNIEYNAKYPVNDLKFMNKDISYEIRNGFVQLK